MSTTKQWSSKDLKDFGRVIRALEEIQTCVPKEKVVDRIKFDFTDIDFEVKQSAIKSWRRKNGVQ